METTKAIADQTFAERYPLRLMRSTTGTVHAGVEVELSGRMHTVKACGFDSSTWTRYAGVGATELPVSCRKCIAVGEAIDARLAR